MTCKPPPFALAVLAEATRISPRRRGAPGITLPRENSDGICADAHHYATGGDHVPDARGIPHAVDISHSVPGAPFWNSKFGRFDAMAYGRAIAQRMTAGTERRVIYLVANFGGADQIYHPAEHGNQWVQNGSYKIDHRSHLHVSFTVAAEQSTAPFFDVEDPVTQAEIAAIAKATRDAIFADPRFDQRVQDAAEAAIAEKTKGYDNRGEVPSLLLIRAREELGIQPPHGS